MAAVRPEQPSEDEAVPQAEPASEPMTPEQKARFDALLRASDAAARQARPGATSDHRDMFDANGLPL